MREISADIQKIAQSYTPRDPFDKIDLDRGWRLSGTLTCRDSK